MRLILGLLTTAVWPALVAAYASTDSIQDADPSQSGYLPDHNMDPNVVSSASFGILWSKVFPNSLESFYAKPLTYTINGGSEMVITASTLNNVRIHDAKTGTLIKERQLLPPFLRSDIGCADIPNFIGVTGTPIIDPATDIIYMFAKGYRDGSASGGMANGVYRMYALQLPTLADVPGFPVLMDGSRADNDPTRYFIGGTVLQRPALATVNGAILVAFGGHCDLFNYTGYVAAVSKTPGVGVLSLFAMESSPGAPSPQPLDLTVEKGGKAGIWQSGMGLAVDGSRLFAVTGNGQGHANGNIPASGRLPLSTLDECVINLAVSADGKISLNDYFEPYDYTNMDAGDRDLGSSGVCLLGSTFKTSTVNRIAVTVGKNSKVYVMNADNLGGFKQGAGGADGVIQTITSSNAVFGGVGSYPLEGGYFYFTPVGDVTYAYKFGTDSSGAPFFTLAGKTPTASAGRVGVGQPTITSYRGQAGSAILWITDVNTGLNAFKAVPDANGILQPITLPATPGINKFQRPAFGNGRVFVTSSNKIYALGSPVNLPLNCTDPVDFGNLESGSSGTATVSCKANIAITKVNGCTTVDPRFQCSNSTLPTGAVAAGTTFSFPVVWDITTAAVASVVNTSYSTVMPGIEGTVLSLFTTNGATGYTSTVPVSLTGTVVSKGPYLFISPGEVDFGGLVLGSADAVYGLTGSATIQNTGNSSMTLLGMAWKVGEEDGAYTNVTFEDTKATFGLGFSAPSFPLPQSVLAAGETLAVPLFFNTSTPGSYAIALRVWSDGGIDDVLLVASAGNAAIASIAVSTSEGGWDNSVPVSLAFGNVLGGTTAMKQLRICNTGGSVLTITKSKPPISPQLTATNPNVDLLEGQKIAIGDCAYGTVAVYSGTVQPSHPSQNINLVWVINTDGLDALNTAQGFGVREVETSVTIVSRQAGPLLADGSARYQWTGCFVDNKGRNLATQVNNSTMQATNTNDQCQNLCFKAGYTFAGTEYHQECWCGNKINYPSTYTNDSLNYCTFSCTGDNTQSCGGDGGYMSLYADTTKFDIKAFLSSISGASSSTTSSTSTGSKTSSTSSSSSTTSTSAVSTMTISTTTASATSLSTTTVSTTTPSTTSLSTTDLSTTSSTVTGDSTTTVSTTSSTVTGDSTASGTSITISTASTSSSSTSTSSTGTSTSTSSATTTTSSASPLNPNQPATVSDKWNYIGCHLDNVNNVRSLNSANMAADTVTLESCAAFCSTYNFFGTEYGRECYCGYTLNTTALKATESSCSTACKGNTAQLCGAGSRLSVFQNSVYQQPPPDPSHVPQAGNYAWAGCYSEATAGRALSLGTVASDDMTVDVCAAFCAGKNAQMMGVEYGRECYCGNTLGVGAALLAASSCNMLCKGNAFSFCGAGSKLDLYTFSPAVATTSSSTSSALPTTTTTSSSSLALVTDSASASSSSSSSSTSSSDISTPTTSSSSLGLTTDSTSSSSSSSTSSSDISTTESQTTSSSSSSSSDSSSSTSSFSSSTSAPSTSTSTTTTSSSVPTTPATTTSSSSSSTSSSVTTTAPTPTATNGYYLLGCYQDTSDGHALPQLVANNSITPELCIDHANSLYSAAAAAPKPTPAARLPYLFIEYHHECYGGTSFDFKGSAVTSLVGTKACTDYCFGSVSTYTTDGVATTTTDLTNMCGGAKQFNLYALETSVVFPTTGGLLLLLRLDEVG
ncbi:WSC domain-containing protein [Cercophora scortea]|uniref:WSC domain-containing protein n=1 Tax=Cercophora scortea TaxID=314031 RepID=A0AAE0MKF8_9PEZI|nr:WSC domain-containing protein [Cercophora scortea]